MSCCCCVCLLLDCTRDVHLQLPRAMWRRPDWWTWPLPLQSWQHRDLHSSLWSSTTRLVVLCRADALCTAVILCPAEIVPTSVVNDGQITESHRDGDCRFDATLLTSVPHRCFNFHRHWCNCWPEEVSSHLAVNTR